jgi:hypothetical protein
MLLIHSAFINLWILWLNWPSSSILFWILFSCNAKFNFVMIYYNNLLLMAGPWKGNYRCYSSSPQESCCNLRWRRHNEVVETLIFFLLYFYVMIINENWCNLSNVYSGAKFNALLGNCCILFQLQVTHNSTDARFRETTPRLFLTRTLCVTTQFKSD